MQHNAPPAAEAAAGHRIDFATSPDRTRHWKLQVSGTLAKIAFACDHAYMFCGTMKGDNRAEAKMTLSPAPRPWKPRIFGRLTAWQNWIFQRPSAVGADGALKRYGTGVKASYDPERI